LVYKDEKKESRWYEPRFLDIETRFYYGEINIRR
jgi:hypothetical protein